jgi:hypothetical protein
MWHGNSRLEASPLDFQSNLKGAGDGERRLEVALSVLILRDAPLYRVRVLLSIQNSQPSSSPSPSGASGTSAGGGSPGGGGASSQSPGDLDRDSNPVATVGGYSPNLSRSGVSSGTPLPFFISCRFVRIALPVTFTELAWDLHELGEQAEGAATNRYKRGDVAHYAALRQLGQSIEFVSRTSGEQQPQPADSEGRLERLKESLKDRLKDRLKRRKGGGDGGRVEGEGMGVPSGAAMITPFDLSEFA